MRYWGALGGVHCIGIASEQVFEQYMSSSARIELLLAQVPILGSLEHDVRASLARKLVLRTYLHNQHVITQGEVGKSMFIVEEGECVVKVAGKGGVMSDKVRTCCCCY